jgi:hypothetical protein
MVFIASNRPIVARLSYQSNSQKLMTKTNISFAPLDIDKSKLTIVDMHSMNFSKTYTYFVFFIKLSNIS